MAAGSKQYIDLVMGGKKLLGVTGRFETAHDAFAPSGSRAKVSVKSPTGEALKYIAKYWIGLNLFLTDGRIEIDNNPVERTIRPIALSRKNALFAGHEAGAQNWAMLASLIETCKLNAVEPHVYISGILTAIVNGHKQSDIESLQSWNFNG